jgi:hypothetical protein
MGKPNLDSASLGFETQISAEAQPTISGSIGWSGTSDEELDRIMTMVNSDGGCENQFIQDTTY